MVDKARRYLTQMFGHFFLNGVQKNILSVCIDENEEEFGKWHFNNVWYPSAILLGTAILVFFYNSYDFEIAVDVLLNGSLSILGISIVFSMSSYLILRKNSHEDELDAEVVNMSDKLSSWGNLVIFFASILYLIQIIALPSGLIHKLLLLLLVIVVLFICIRIGVKSFIIRDDFYMNSVKKKFKKADGTGNKVDSFLRELEKGEE